jgi:hypothetical protein
MRPAEDLWQEYVTLSNQIVALVEDVARDEIAYRREYWRLWRTYDDALSAVARSKNCEAGCVEMAATWLERRASLAAAHERLASVRDQLVGGGHLDGGDRRVPHLAVLSGGLTELGV